jgi:PRTRC genetic system protein B
MNKKKKEEKTDLIGVISVYENLVLYHSNKNGELSAGKLLDKESMKKIFKFLQTGSDLVSYKFEGMVPENVLKYNSDNGDLLFYTKPQRRTMIFKKDLPVQTAEYNLPYILWQYTNGSLKVFSLKSKPKNEKDILYNAPFFNTNSSGLVCMGNVNYKNNTGKFNGFMDQLQELFFNSIFNASHNNKMATENIIDFYEKAKSKDFNWNEYLVKSSYTLKNVL